jgi:hypothetical protein
MRELRLLLTAVITLATLGTAHSSFAQGQPGLRPPGVAAFPNGIYVVTAQVWVDHGEYAVDNNHPCNADHAAQAAAIAAAVQLAVRKNRALAWLATPLVNSLASQAVQEIANKGGDLGALLVPERAANCSLLAVKIPYNARVEGYEYRVGDGGYGVFPCPGQYNQDCGAGWSRFDPAQQNGQTVTALFRNWSHDRARWASFSVVYSLR